MDTLLGWTFKQWALATGLLGSEPETLTEASLFKRDWLMSGRNDPLEELIIYTGDGGDTRKANYDVAVNLFSLPMA